MAKKKSKDVTDLVLNRLAECGAPEHLEGFLQSDGMLVIRKAVLDGAWFMIRHVGDGQYAVGYLKIT